MATIALPLFGYALLAATWTWIVWGPAPQVVPNADGGNVASMAAGWLERSRFAQDPVLGTPDTSLFYMALTVPVTMLLGRVLGDIGSGYIVQAAPLIFAQLVGFHLLGLRLFGRSGLAAALALLTIPPVLVFPGELWGMLAAPLTRAYAAAALPWILLLMLGRGGGERASPWIVMAACGATVYLHPVSAPGLAAGCWLALVADRPQGMGWALHAHRMALATLVFVALALPFTLVYMRLLPGTSPEALGDAATVAASLRAAADALYFDVGLVVQALVHDSAGGRWPVWLVGAIAMIAVPWLDASARRLVRMISCFVAGIILSSLGLATLDQAIAATTGGSPVQLDLVRNIRFVVPILLLLCVWLAATAFERTPGSLRRMAMMLGVWVFVAFWWALHPTPISQWISAPLGFSSAPQAREAEARLLVRLSQLPPESRILPIAASRHSYRPIELLGLAVRYAAFQPVVYLEKDGNLLSYSGSRGAVQWLRTRPDAMALREAHPPDSNAILARMIERLRPDYLVVHETITPPHLLPTLVAAGPTLAIEGPWRIVAVSASARERAAGR